jgi:hypothetical protein
MLSAGVLLLVLQSCWLGFDVVTGFVAVSLFFFAFFSVTELQQVAVLPQLRWGSGLTSSQ